MKQVIFLKILHASFNRLPLQLVDHQVKNLTGQNHHRTKAIPRQANDNNFSILATVIYTQVLLPFSKRIIDSATQHYTFLFFNRDYSLVFNAIMLTTVPVMAPMC